MTLLLSREALVARRAAVDADASRTGLGALADSLAADLEPVLAREIRLPPEKARLTRRGGRCHVDGTLLAFDPFEPRRHACPLCGREYREEEHYRWWIMNYQLWLAERAVHAAALHALRGDARHATFARDTLLAIAARYRTWPNQDNALGPTRPFFSTYLESIWLLQLCVALDLLEGAGVADGAGGEVRERVIAPSEALIAEFDEGMSNRQVWNNAARLAARRLLGLDPSPLLDGASGLAAHLTSSLLEDGTWYEGENYHLFAHRGLWYGMVMGHEAGWSPHPALVRRFDEGFVTPFLTALPDFTFPSRRDSQYAVSLRQWRFAELAELGLARNPADRRLAGALETLYSHDVARGETQRERSTAEAERNTPPTALTRADLGWRSLLHALPGLPPLRHASPGSLVLPSQGYAMIRRDGGRTYVALDYGESGGGHGHPDRLNLVLQDGHTRWLDDLGTGSYTESKLFWYRSTLAHNAPLFDGRSQDRVAGRLLAFEDRGGAGWIRARADGVADGVRIERTIVVMPEYLLDVLAWRAEREVTCELPMHADGETHGVARWHPGAAEGGDAPDDGFAFIEEREDAVSMGALHLAARSADGDTADAWVLTEPRGEWWRARAPGAPGRPPARFHVARQRGTHGVIRTVWSWEGAVSSAEMGDGGVHVVMRDGSEHVHSPTVEGWHVELLAHGARSSIDLGGFVEHGSRVPESTLEWEPEGDADDEPKERSTFIGEVAGHADLSIPVHRVPLVLGSSVGDVLSRGFADGARATLPTFELGESHYRRSEPTWREAGSPTASVTLAVVEGQLLGEACVRKPELFFAPRLDENPLDNEHPDVNSDGAQLYVMVLDPAVGWVRHAWILVPEPDGVVRITPREGNPQLPILARWNPVAGGYDLRFAIPLRELGARLGDVIAADLVINDMAPGRERRRGQLVMAGAEGEFVYLRGDRQPPQSHVYFLLPDA